MIDSDSKQFKVVVENVFSFIDSGELPLLPKPDRRAKYNFIKGYLWACTDLQEITEDSRKLLLSLIGGLFR